MSADPVKLQVIFTGVQSRVDRSYKLTFSTRELNGQDAAKLLTMANTEAWLIIAPDDSIDNVDVPKARPDAGVGQKTPSQRLRAVTFVYWKQIGSPGDFDTWYAGRIENIIRQYKDKLDGGEIQA